MFCVDNIIKIESYCNLVTRWKL